MTAPWDRDDTVMTTNLDGQEVPSIPLPFYVYFGNKCGTCKAWFWSMKGYRGHYALEHILKMRGRS